MVTFEHSPYVLVGYDGSAEAKNALRWGVEEARLRRRPLVVCHAWHWPYPEKPIDSSLVETVRRMAEHVPEKAVRIAHSQATRAHRAPTPGHRTCGLLPAQRSQERRNDRPRLARHRWLHRTGRRVGGRARSRHTRTARPSSSVTRDRPLAASSSASTAPRPPTPSWPSDSRRPRCANGKWKWYTGVGSWKPSPTLRLPFTATSRR
jgi:Universal stress protein family.